MSKNPMPKVEYSGNVYTLLSRKTEIPDFSKMTTTAVLVWLIQNTRALGYSTTPAQSLNFGGAIKVSRS